MAILTLNEKNFDDAIAQHNFLIIDFWAEWCGPCKMFSKVIDAAAEKYPDITFAKVNIDEERKLAMDFQVQSIPFIVIVRDKIAVYAQPGALSLSALENLITQTRNLDIEALKKKIAEKQGKQS